jgi:hypothetical protein
LEQMLDLWNSLFHDGLIVTMKGHIPGDIEATIEPGIGNRQSFQDPGGNFVVIMRACSDCRLLREDGTGGEAVHDLAAIWDAPSLIDVRQDGDYLVFDCVIGELRLRCDGADVFLDSGSPVSYAELEKSCNDWWRTWREYWDRKKQDEA